MVVLDAASIRCEWTCEVCHAQLDPTDPGVVVVRVPQFEAHAICADDWSVLIVSAWAWIESSPNEDTLAYRGRCEDAYKRFFAQDV